MGRLLDAKLVAVSLDKLASVGMVGGINSGADGVGANVGAVTDCIVSVTGT